MKVILICNPNEFSEAALAKLRELGEVKWYDQAEIDLMSVPELTDDEPKILALSPVPVGWKIPEGFYDHIQNVKAICLPVTGYEFIDAQKLKNRDIVLSYTPYYSTNAVAEYAIFLMLSLLRRLPIQLQANHAYEFSDQNLGEECTGKTAGIIGFGHIGQRVAELCERLGMKVVYWSRSPKQTSFHCAELDDVLAASDILFPCYEINADTECLLGSEKLQKLKPTSYVVNIMHGGLPTSELIQMVHDGRLAGVAFEDEALARQPQTGNLFITAPLAWYTKESLTKNIELWEEAIAAAVGGKPINQSM